MKKSMHNFSTVYTVLLLGSAVFALYFHIVAAPQIDLTYNVGSLMLQLFVMAPLFYVSLAALVTEIAQQAGFLKLPDGVRKACLVVGGVLTALWLLYALLNTMGIQMPVAVGSFMMEWPQAFLLLGIVLSVGLHRDRKAG